MLYLAEQRFRSRFFILAGAAAESVSLSLYLQMPGAVKARVDCVRKGLQSIRNPHLGLGSQHVDALLRVVGAVVGAALSPASRGVQQRAPQLPIAPITLTR